MDSPADCTARAVHPLYGMCAVYLDVQSSAGLLTGFREEPIEFRVEAREFASGVHVVLRSPPRMRVCLVGRPCSVC